MASTTPKRTLGAAVIQDSIQVIRQHLGQSLKGWQSLPSQLIDPTLQHQGFEMTLESNEGEIGDVSIQSSFCPGSRGLAQSFGLGQGCANT
jgi:hypothetical protein